MTWDQFKELVDNALTVEGKDGTVELDSLRYLSKGRQVLDVHIERYLPKPTLQVWND
jgi:hypothetical protein